MVIIISLNLASGKDTKAWAETLRELLLEMKAEAVRVSAQGMKRDWLRMICGAWT